METKFCEKLTAVIESKKVKKIDLARALNVSRQTVHSWTTGRTVPPATAPMTQDEILAAISRMEGICSHDL